MSDTNYFKLRLTATTTKLYDYLTNTCLSHGSYLNPIKLGPFIHGWTDNTYAVGNKNPKAVDESLPEVDDTYNGIKWLVEKSDWIEYDSRIKAPKIQYIEIVNMNPFQQSGDLSYYEPMTKSDWKGYFLPDDSTDTSFTAAPNGRLYLAPEDENDGKKLSVLISDKDRNDGIIAAFNIGFTIEVKDKTYSCIIDPLLKVKSPNIVKS